MFYCEVCNNILDITRTKPGIEGKNEEPSNVSSGSEQNDEENYEKILKKLESGDEISNEELASIDISRMIKLPYYKKINNKGKLKKKLMNMIEDMTNSDLNIKAYYMCRNCSFSSPIKSGYHVISLPPEGENANPEIYEHPTRLSNLVHSNILPRTRNFKCPNVNCGTNKSKIPTEAVFFRMDNVYQLIYICTVCQTVKRN